jgi:hypothetical protein
MDQKKRLDRAAKDLAAVFEKHFSGLPPKEREVKSEAFREVIAKIGTRAKSEEPPKTPGNRRAGRRPE